MSNRQGQRVDAVSAVLRRAAMPDDVAVELARITEDNVMRAIARGRAAGRSAREVETDAIAELSDLFVVLSAIGAESGDVVRSYHDEVVTDGALSAARPHPADGATTGGGGLSDVRVAGADPAGPGAKLAVAAAATSSPVEPIGPIVARPVEGLTVDAPLDWGGRSEGSGQASDGARVWGVESTPGACRRPGTARGRLTWALVAAVTVGGLASGVAVIAGGSQDSGGAVVPASAVPTLASTPPEGGGGEDGAPSVQARSEATRAATEPGAALSATSLAAGVSGVDAVPAAGTVASRAGAPSVVPEAPTPVAVPEPSREPVRLGGVPWEGELEALVQTVTSRRGWGALWETDSAEAERRLAGGRANRREELDERPGVSRIEVHRQDKREFSRPHLGLEFLNDRLYLAYLYYGKSAGVSAGGLAATLTKAHGPAVGNWDEGRRRKCTGWEVTTAVRIALCKLMSPSGTKVQELLVLVYEPSTYARLLSARARAVDAYNALEGGKYVTSYRAYDDALQRFDQVLADLPSFEIARAWRAITLLCARRVPEARAEVEAVRARARSYATLAFADWVMARIQVYEGRPDQATASLDAAAAQDPWNGDFETYATELRTGKLSGMFCAKVAAWADDEQRDGNHDRGEVVRRAGIPEPAWLDQCVTENADRDPAWTSNVTDLVDKWRDRRAGR